MSRPAWTAIRDETGYTVPAGPADELAELFAAIM
jgi:hypothetical protein